MASKLHPLQLNFKDYINNPTLSDIQLKAISTTPIHANDEFEAKLDDDHDHDVIYAHWDILRARCVVFDLLFHAICNHQCRDIPIADVVYIDEERSVIAFAVSYTALLLVVKYLYTGIIGSHDCDDLTVVRDVMRLADVLHLRALRVEMHGKFVASRKQLKMSGTNHLSTTPNSDHGVEDWYRGWRALKLDTFDVNAWRNHQDNVFFNANVLYQFDAQMHQRFASRQLVRVDQHSFQLSKIVFVALSSYFRAMFCGRGTRGGCSFVWKESQHAHDEVVDLNTDFVPMKAADFERLQRFLYTFDASTYFSKSFLGDSDIGHASSSADSLQSIMAAFHLSIYFGIDDLRQCLVSVLGQYFLCINSLHAIWAFAIEYELRDIQRLCCRYFAKHFFDISMQLPVLLKLSKTMMKAALSSGAISVPTHYLLEVLLKWAHYHQTHIHDLLPPNTLFNEANKHFILSTARLESSASPQHLL